MQEDGKRILEMVRDGKLTVDEAQRVFDAMEPERDTARAAAPDAPVRFMRIRVKDEDGARVNLNVPVSLAKVFWRFVPKETAARLAEENVDIDTILAAVMEGAQGKLVDLDTEDGTKVEISVD
ncbi:MAG: hypothetical protein VB144_03385 [Clostridia bacterium]|nr:hypothetical protein [Clostridia bacterium]